MYTMRCFTTGKSGYDVKITHVEDVLRYDGLLYLTLKDGSERIINPAGYPYIEVFEEDSDAT